MEPWRLSDSSRDDVAYSTTTADISPDDWMEIDRALAGGHRDSAIRLLRSITGMDQPTAALRIDRRR